MYFISFIILSISTGITLGVYGIKIANLFDYSLYTVLKKISLFHFIDSIENISMVLWILYVLNASAMVLYSVISAVKETFNINKNKIIIGVLFALAILIPKILPLLQIIIVKTVDIQILHLEHLSINFIGILNGIGAYMDLQSENID